MRSNVFTLLDLIFIWSLYFAKFCVEAAVNITVDDTDPSILYQPAEFWTANSKSCKSCLQVDLSLAYNRSYHLGTHVIATDGDDFVSSSSLSIPSTASLSSSSQSAGSTSALPPPPPTSVSNQATVGGSGDGDNHIDDDDEDEDDDNDHNDRDDDDDDRDNDRDDHQGSGDGQGKAGRSLALLDADDPGFIDSVITAQFKFAGTAVYLYAIEPLFQSTSPLSPTAMNLTFTLDNAPMGRFFHNESSPGGSSFASNVLVFSQTNLNDKPHVLLVTLQPEATFIFDYMAYTSTDPVSASTTADPSSPTESSASSNKSKHSIATFAGAIAGSAGALGLLALCIFISLCLRRRIAARRERRQQRSDPENTDSTSSSSPTGMIGPRPFVPRYFPGTVLPPSYEDQRTPYVYSDPEDIDAHSAAASEESNPSTATVVSTTPLMTHSGIPILTIPSAPPPTYVPSARTSLARSSTMSVSTSTISSPSFSNTSSTDGGRATSNGTSSRIVPITYADIPPSIAPPPEGQLDIPLILETTDVLPTFGEALSSPIVSPVSLLPLTTHVEHEEDVDGSVDATRTPNPASGVSGPTTEAGATLDVSEPTCEPETPPPTTTQTVSSHPQPSSSLSSFPPGLTPPGPSLSITQSESLDEAQTPNQQRR
ncbi:hypothetical protein D9758_012091 [Tetrapyrgos nigripes]|uniref:Uncharacterized protein n=1 Tax=Tetrapyrgos nigripes TaxID=182062 RepID=A0A8H5CBM7_9AGAR|nr:hypothetical protein D9758_012091 [Tetrapyrgos nigripes]